MDKILNSKVRLLIFSANLLIPVVVFSIPEKYIDFEMEWITVFLCIFYIVYRLVRVAVSIIKNGEFLYHSIMLAIFIVALVVAGEINTNEYLPDSIDDINASYNWNDIDNCPCISKEHEIYGVMMKTIEEPKRSTGSARTVFGVYQKGIKVYEFKLSENYSFSKVIITKNGFLILNNSNDENYLSDEDIISKLPRYIHVQAE